MKILFIGLLLISGITVAKPSVFDIPEAIRHCKLNCIKLVNADIDRYVAVLVVQTKYLICKDTCDLTFGGITS